MSGTRDENVFMAKIAEQAERFDDMVEYMKRVAAMGSELSSEERNMLSVAYKSAVSNRRQACRAVHTWEQKERVKSEESRDLIAGYRGKVEEELKSKCGEILQILDQYSIPGATDVESQTFYMKMKGDYHRYRAEFAAGADQEAHSVAAHDAYAAATETAKQLPAVHAVRLGLALNFSVFYHEVYRKADQACSVAKGAYDDAQGELQHITEEQFQECAPIMQLLLDNLNLWTSAARAEDGRLPPEQDGTAVEDF